MSLSFSIANIVYFFNSSGDFSMKILSISSLYYNIFHNYYVIQMLNDFPIIFRSLLQQLLLFLFDVWILTVNTLIITILLSKVSNFAIDYDLLIGILRLCLLQNCKEFKFTRTITNRTYILCQFICIKIANRFFVAHWIGKLFSCGLT